MISYRFSSADTRELPFATSNPALRRAKQIHYYVVLWYPNYAVQRHRAFEEFYWQSFGTSGFGAYMPVLQMNQPDILLSA